MDQATKDHLKNMARLRRLGLTPSGVRTLTKLAVLGGQITLTPAARRRLFSPVGDRKMAPQNANGGETRNKMTRPPITKDSRAAKLFGSARVKTAAERLSTKRYEAKRHGSPVEYAGRIVEHPSEYDRALVGTWFKASLLKMGFGQVGDRPLALSEFERGLLHDSAQRDQWVDQAEGEPVSGHRVKALLDDTVSGGIYANPVVLDQSIVVRPLLSGQLAPMVDTKMVTARRITVPSMAPLTLQWGQAAGTSASLYDTTSLISPLDTPVYPVAGFLELSNELSADSPIDLGAAVIEQYGEKLKSELDRVIAVGNGLYEPSGIVGTSGLTSVTSDNGVGGPPTVSDYESLIYAVPLQYRQQDLSPCFLGNDISYRRVRAIPVGPADERRVFALNAQTAVGVTQSYRLFEYGFAVQPDVPNTKVAFACLKKYRLYQRLGLELFRETAGRTLTLTNVTLIGIRARFGGRVVDPNAFALCTTMQS